MASTYRVVALVFLISLTNSRFCIATAEQQPIASFFGDPHFQGADGVHFRFTGLPGQSYCLLSDPSLHINMEMAGESSSRNAESSSAGGDSNAPTAAHRTWVKAIGVLVAGHSLQLRARQGEDASLGDGFLQSLVLDDVAQQLSPSHILESDDGALLVHHVGVTESNGLETETIRIQAGGRHGAEFLVHIRPEAVDRQSPGDAFVHFSVEVLSGGGLTDPHGVMGQTFRRSQKERSFAVGLRWSDDAQAWEVAGDNGDGYLDGSVDSYRSTGLVAADCAFSRFKEAAGAAGERREQSEGSWAVTEMMAEGEAAEGEAAGGGGDVAPGIAGAVGRRLLGERRLGG
ncbi:hypothetical protein CLOM_g2123 [Closterium sp. NIES-68]|nr:hypothetical protein CLOM_g2123 [Closterium sp. NIES-68]GJP70832.1 hypothetical protein CLOP_g1727 [Closterium sp. NIES-67]